MVEVVSATVVVVDVPSVDGVVTGASVEVVTVDGLVSAAGSVAAVDVATGCEVSVLRLEVSVVDVDPPQALRTNMRAAHTATIRCEEIFIPLMNGIIAPWLEESRRKLPQHGHRRVDV